MDTQFHRTDARRRVRYRIRKKLHGTASRPRVAVFRSLKHIYVQAIDDEKGTTLVQASTLDKPIRSVSPQGGTVDAAKRVGSLLAERLKDAGIESVVFDRGGFAYHGRIKALAEAAREGGLKF